MESMGTAASSEEAETSWKKENKGVQGGFPDTVVGVPLMQALSLPLCYP